MNAPRLEIDLDKIEHNAKSLVHRLGKRGISVTGITKSTLGSTDIAGAMIRSGITSLGDSRTENIEILRRAEINASLTLICSPMLSQAKRVVENADISLNTELEVIKCLSTAAVENHRVHGIILMAELGDLREGILPSDMETVMRETLNLPGIELMGIGTNLACRHGVSPDDKKMSELSALTESLENTFGIHLKIVSGGNSANIDWALSSAHIGRINNLRLGESILLGCETLHRQPIEGLHTNAFTLIAEVIESKIKPSQPWGTMAQNAFGEYSEVEQQGKMLLQIILAIGRLDIDPKGLIAPTGITIVDASSDHLIIQSDRPLFVGTELKFQINYNTLTRAMISPYVTKHIIKR